MDSCRDRVNACNPPEGPTDQQYENIILQVLPSEYGRIRQTHLERRNFGVADIRRMMAAIYEDNLFRSESSKAIAGRGAQCRRWTGAALVSYVITAASLSISKNVPTPNQTPLAAAAAAISASSTATTWSESAKAARTSAKQRWGRRRACVCGVHITRQRPTTTPSSVSNSTKPAATLMWSPPKLSASKESAAPTICPRRMTSQNAPISHSRQPRYKARQS